MAKREGSRRAPDTSPETMEPQTASDTEGVQRYEDLASYCLMPIERLTVLPESPMLCNP